MRSFWERESFTRYDHIIIGSGITGMSAGIALKTRFPGERVLILERGLLPTGATTRNAGFACMGVVRSVSWIHAKALRQSLKPGSGATAGSR